MKAKVLQIGYEPERDRLIWDGWDIHCGTVDSGPLARIFMIIVPIPRTQCI